MQYEQRNDRFSRIAKQAQFTRPKYLPADLAGLGQDEPEQRIERRIKWHEMAIAFVIGATIAAACLWLLACYHVVP